MNKGNKRHAPRQSSTQVAGWDGGQIESVFLILEGAVQATLLVAVARALAQIEGAALHVLPMGIRFGSPPDMAHDLHLAEEQLHGCVFHHAQGTLAESILRGAGELPRALVVMPAHIGGGKPDLAAGPVAEEVLLQSSAPIVLIPREATDRPWHLRQILLPHDGTPVTAAALGPAMELARQAQAGLMVVHIVSSTPSRVSEPGTMTSPRYTDQPQHEWPAWTNEFVERMRALSHEPAPVKLRLLVAAGEPGAEIVRITREHNSDLVILAWRGMWEAERASVVKAVVQRSPSPVLIVRTASE